MEDAMSLRETGLHQKYDELKSFNPLQTNEILLILNVIYNVQV